MLMRLADPITLLLNCSLTLKDDLPCHWKEKNNSISSAWKKMFDVTVFWEIGKRNSSKSLMKDSGSSLKMSAAFTNPTSGKIDQQRKILEVRGRVSWPSVTHSTCGCSRVVNQRGVAAVLRRVLVGAPAHDVEGVVGDVVLLTLWDISEGGIDLTFE